jgi:hypothetical protein
LKSLEGKHLISYILSFSCHRKSFDSFLQLFFSFLISNELELEVPVQHGPVMILKLRDLRDVRDFGAIDRKLNHAGPK